MPKPRTLKLSPDLEKALLAGVVLGAIPADLVDPEELSNAGRATYGAAKRLYATGATPPLHLEAILLCLTDDVGVQRDPARAFLEAVYGAAAAGGAAGDTLKRVREKHALLTVINAASAQLQTNTYDPGRLAEVLKSHAAAATPKSLADQLAPGFPDPPRYIPLHTMPKLTERLGGLIGMVAVGGEPGVGKSTIAWQWSLDAARHIPVVYYDLENGFATLVARTRQMFNDDRAKILSATRQLFLRESAKELESDLLHVPAPAVVVVDSVQKLPTSVEFRKPGLDRWIHRLEGLKKHGYYILIVSEVPRAQYGMGPFIGAFKETGEIEYSCDVTLQMLPTDMGVELHVTKNRHGSFRGLCVSLKRDRGFIWREVGSTAHYADVGGGSVSHPVGTR